MQVFKYCGFCQRDTMQVQVNNATNATGAYCTCCGCWWNTYIQTVTTYHTGPYFSESKEQTNE